MLLLADIVQGTLSLSRLDRRNIWSKAFAGHFVDAPTNV